ncbi:Programmed cell death protein 6 [Leucoagaricus sp. SymC.cos]|nr:Programmed cell death protein 6 [Leucoagaricus sp. SymC.cos]
MLLTSTYTPNTSTDIPVLIVCYDTRRVFMLKPPTYVELISNIRQKFDIEAERGVSVETVALDVCRGSKVEIDENAWSVMRASLDEVTIIVSAYTSISGGVGEKERHVQEILCEEEVAKEVKGEAIDDWLEYEENRGEQMDEERPPSVCSQMQVHPDDVYQAEEEVEEPYANQDGGDTHLGAVENESNGGGAMEEEPPKPVRTPSRRIFARRDSEAGPSTKPTRPEVPAPEERFQVRIEGPHPDQHAEIKTRGKHLVKKVLAAGYKTLFVLASSVPILNAHPRITLMTKPKYTPHPDYWIPGGDLYLRVEQTLFRVHSYFFIRESKHWKDQLVGPISPGDEPLKKGQGEKEAIVIDEEKVEDFAQFLWVFYNDTYGNYSKASPDQWKAIMHFAAKWGFNEVKELSVRHLQDAQMGLVERIRLYQENKGYGGGFAPLNQAPGPPPGADPQLWSWFTAVDTDRSGHITAEELRMFSVSCLAFDLDTVKLLMTLFDTDRSGTIGFNEFSGLWKYVKDWQNVFRHFDRDHSGSIDGPELQQALTQFGFNISPVLIQLVQKKYDIKASGQHLPGQALPGISFDRFVRACVVVKQLTESFQNLDTDKDGWIQISYDQFMQTVLHLP